VVVTVLLVSLATLATLRAYRDGLGRRNAKRSSTCVSKLGRFEARRIANNFGWWGCCTNRIARWAYEQTETADELTWIKGDELLALSTEWRKYISTAA
jgi:hypothetical protein